MYKKLRKTEDEKNKDQVYSIKEVLNRMKEVIKNVPENGKFMIEKNEKIIKIVEAKTLKQFKVLKDNEFINNKLYYYDIIKHYLIIKYMSKMKITTPRILPRFPTTSEIFPLKMMRQ